MVISLLLFGLFGGCMLSILVGVLGSRRHIGFGWAFILSLILTPFVGLIITLISDQLPPGERRYGCIGNLILLLVMTVLVLTIFALMTGALVLA